MTTRAREELTAVKSPGLVRPIDAPSRGSEGCCKVWFRHDNCRVDLSAAHLSTAALNTRGSARVSA